MLRREDRVSADDLRLLADARAWWHSQRLAFASLTPQKLLTLAKSHGIEFATAVFHEAALGVDEHAEFFSAVPNASVAAMEPPDLIAVVPGAFYREHPGNGADGGRVVDIAREIGCAAEIIPIPGFGRLEDNARIIADWLCTRTERRIALVSLSKGGPDVKRALGRPNAARAFAHVHLWVSYSGIVQGTPLIAWLRARPLRWWSVLFLLWWHRHPRGTLHDLRHEPGAPLGRWPAIPPHLRIVHICGVPLRAHLQHAWAPRAYERLAPLGPNDGGGVLLGALSNVPGIVCPVWGADHYFQPSWNATSLLRDIVVAALTPLDRRHANQSAPAPTAAPAIRSTT